MRSALFYAPQSLVDSSVDRSVSAMLTPISVVKFGATLTSPDNRIAIQAAIDSGFSDIYLPRGEWIVSLNPASQGLTGVFGNSSVSLHPRSNVRIFGPGTIKLKAGEAGASGAIIGNWNGQPISNFILDGITIDGNRVGTTGQVSGAVLVDATECGFRNVRARHLSYVGLQMKRFAGYDGVSQYGVKDCWVEDCIVNDVAYIGLQFKRYDGLRVFGNRVSYTGDNAIDIEANNDTSAPGYGNSLVVSDNILSNCTIGIFMESVGNAILANNFIRTFTTCGMYFNRINSGSEYTVVTSNMIKDAAGLSGIIISNSSGKTRISDNMFNTLAYSIDMQKGTYVSVGKNYHANITEKLVRISQVANALVKSRIVQQDFEGPRLGTTGKPFTCSPLNNAANLNTRAYNSLIEPLFDMDNGRAAVLPDDEYKTGRSGTIDSNGSWGAYSIFFNGETVIYETGTGPTIGRYITINGSVFQVFGVGAAGEYKIRSSTGVAGNYTATTNGAYDWVEYWAEWQTT